MNFVKNQLLLLEQDLLFKDFKDGAPPSNVIIQNPFKGLVKFVESESDKLQILINATYNVDYYRRDEVVKYHVNRYNNELNIKLMSEPPEQVAYRSTIVNTNSAGVYESNFLPLYVLVAIALFCVFVTFLLSTIFALWWNKNKRPDATKTLHYKVDTVNMQNMSKKENIISPDLTSGGCQAFASSLRSGSLGGPGQAGLTMVPCNSGGIEGLTNPGSVGISAEQMPFILTGVFDDYPVESVDLMNSLNAAAVAAAAAASGPNSSGGMVPGGVNAATLLAAASIPGTSYSLDPTFGGTLLYTSAGDNNFGGGNATYSPAAAVGVDHPAASGIGGMAAAAGTGSLTYQRPYQRILNSSSSSGIPLVSTGFPRSVVSSPTESMSFPRHFHKDMLDESIADRMGLNILTQISEKDIAEFNTIAGYNSGSQGKQQCPLDAAGVYHQQSNNTGQGSDETSGILSDSSGSTLDKPAQCSNAKITAGFSIVPSVISSNERYVSLDANDQRYVPLSNVIAEVAQCPQHSYLVKAAAVAAAAAAGSSTNQIQQSSDCSQSASMPTNSVVHGVQVHSAADNKMSSANISNVSSFQTAVGVDDSTSYFTRETSPNSRPEFSSTLPLHSKGLLKTASGRIDSSSHERKGQSKDSHYYELERGEDDEEGDGDKTVSSSPKSALRGSRSSSRVSKQLRFTTLGLLGFVGCILLGLGAVDATRSTSPTNSLMNGINRAGNYGMDATNLFNVTLEPSSESSILTSAPNKKHEEINPLVMSMSARSERLLDRRPFLSLDMTIFVPRWMRDDVIGQQQQQPQQQQQQQQQNQKRRKSGYERPRQKFESLRLYLNESSGTEVDMGEFPRKIVEIYDIKNSLNILSPKLCRKRYSCSHTCDPGNGHRCVCQRGFLLERDDKSCADRNECTDAGNLCARLGGQCFNYPGTYQCQCDGKPCRDCSEECPTGYFKTASCRQSRFLKCQKCKQSCQSGYYISRPCTAHSNTQCTACSPLCITGEYELSPCSGSSNRVCKTIDSIPGIELPDKKNVWYEDRRGLTDISHVIINEEAHKFSQGKVILLERKSGYQIRLEFESEVTLEPQLEPVDHSQANDNKLFRTDPNNFTLKNLCPYPLPPKYSLNMLMHYNVTTDVVNDPSLPGYRAALHPCKTYIMHGSYPDPIKSMEAVYRRSVYENNYNPIHSNVVSCVDPGKLPGIFGDRFNEELAIRDGIYVEEKHVCNQHKASCQKCLVGCAEHMISNSLVCQPTSSPADNGRSPRLEMCFDCCAKDNCTALCERYSRNNCAMHLCMAGSRMDLSLEPDWPTMDRFICHMKLSDQKPIYKFKWSLMKEKKQLTMDEFPSSMLFTDKSKGTSSSSSSSSSGGSSDGGSGTGAASGVNSHMYKDVVHIYRDLLHVTYSPNIGTLPNIVSGNNEIQVAGQWNTERLPLATSSARLQPGGRSATIEVWPHQPLLVNSGMWGTVNQGDCRHGDQLVNQLNNYTNQIPPYRELNNLRVKREGRYRYGIRSQYRAPRLNITVPASASLLGAIFDRRIYVSRQDALSATLMYLGPGGGVGAVNNINLMEGMSAQQQRQNGAWIVEVAGQVSNFPGCFRLQLWNGDPQIESSTKDDKEYSRSSSSSSSSSKSSTSRNENSNRRETMSRSREDHPLLDYDIGVFEERNFRIHLRVPAPSSQPNFDKTFLVRIIDAHGTLDIFVHRAQQDPDKVMQIERYARSQNGKYIDEPSILPEVMSVSGEKSLKETSPLGIPKLVMFTVVVVLVFCLVLLLIGHLTRKEEHLCEDIVFKTRHLFVFVIYMTVKAIYCFSITTTALLIVLVIYTGEPYMQLTSQGAEYNNNSVAERLLMGRMDAHLEREIARQLHHVVSVKERCDNRLKRYYDRLNKNLEEISVKAARRRSRVLISQAVVERAQYELKNVIDQLTRNLEDFNKTAKIYMKKIKHDMVMTKKKLTETEWLEGARLIYQEVLKKRRENPPSSTNTDDPAKSFLAWLKITGELPESPPRLTLPTMVPFPDWAKMDVELPQPRYGSGLDAEYGPEYKPFSPKDKDLELEQSIWSYYDPPQDSSSGINNKDQYQQRGQGDSDTAGGSAADGGGGGVSTALYLESIESIYGVLTQLTWHHLMAVTLLLDILWLLHRAAHTIDTAEQIIYGYPCFIDCTAKGKRRRKRNENNFKFMLKKTFCETMESTFVPKFCGSAFALFVLYLLSNHLNELISEEALDFVGYYDNMALPAHLRNRFVNTQVVQSAKQLNEFELSSYEQFVHQRQSEIQEILNSWVDWISQLEQYQCDILKHYKLTEDGKLISDILNKPNKVPIPSHCRMTEQDRERERIQQSEFKMSVCPVKFVVPKLFTDYNETEVSMQIVKSSRHWLKWTRQWVDVVLQCIFGYISALILWNTVGATVWFFVKRFSLIRQKRIYESDFHAIPSQSEESNLKTSSIQ